MTEDTDITEGFRRLDVGCISDALDRLGMTGGLLGIRPLTSGPTVCGPAFTVRYVQRGTSSGTVGDYLEDVPRASIVVLDNRGQLDCSVWGDLLSVAAERQGIQATVIDGVCRDVPGIRRANYRVFSRGAYMVTGKGRVCLESVQQPVQVAATRVEPADLIVADDTGVICVPWSRARQVLQVAQEIAQAEREIEERVMQGISLREARHTAGYHLLQAQRR
jgi:4-hydroxy-4-methyl-2-oxoglutarate aldolase